MKKRLYTYGILPDVDDDDQAEYIYGAKKINLEEKCGGFVALPRQDVTYQVNYIIAFLRNFFAEIYFIYVLTALSHHNPTQTKLGKTSQLSRSV